MVKVTTNLIEYMKINYKKDIHKPKQPLLFVNMLAQRIYLIPEFCHEASLPENFTSDSRKMRAIDEYKIKNPQDRYKRTVDLVNKIFNNPEFKNW